MAVSIYRCGVEQALRLRRQMAPEQPDIDNQAIISDMWVARCNAGELALLGMVRSPEARLLWFITSPLLSRHLCSFVRHARRFLQRLKTADEMPLLAPVTAKSGARLAALLGMHRLIRCRDGVEYWAVED